MTLENQLIQKTYYETLMEENVLNHPVQVLGEAYINEQKKEIPDLAPIRFAQGEVYFQNKDFETAIFKWENITGELQSWAQKNTADAYYELGLLSNAEDIYKSIAADDVTLRTEVGLQLFSLYIERGKLELADQEIKRVVSVNPDYPNVTDIGRAFFEEQKDWASAVELAVNEGIRTESRHWFEILKTYVDKGFTRSLAPEYFSGALLTLPEIDRKLFEQLVCSLWESYKNVDSYFPWIMAINNVMLNIDVNRDDSWHGLSAQYHETYIDLIDGKYLLKKLESVIPDLLINWLRITDSAHSLLASASVLAWNEMFPSSIGGPIITVAENVIANSTNETDGMEEALDLFETIVKWAKNHQLPVGYRMESIIREIADLQSRNLLIAGLSTAGKASFVNTLLGGDLVNDSSSTVVMFRDHEHFEIKQITDSEVTDIADLAAYREIMDRRRHSEGTLIEFHLPSPVLYETAMTVVDTPGINETSHGINELFKYLHIADSLLFVLDANAPFTNKEQELLVKMREQAPDIPIHFILNKMDAIENEQEAIKMVDQTWSRINAYLPNAKVFAFSSKYESGQQLKDFAEFITSTATSGSLREERTEKLLFFIRTTITSLLQQRFDRENSLVDAIKWNEEMSVKLNGAIHQLSDIEAEKTAVIKKSYNRIKEDIKQDLAETIPGLLKESSGLIREDSDFGKIHLELNDEMNERIQNYLQQTLLPKFHLSLQEWISHSREEFTQSQNYLEEMCEGFNTMYGEERIILDCDFKVLDDWRRDANRMTSGVHLEKINILLRFTPSQFLLKSAGKLFGAIPQNKTMLYNKYKTFVESEEYIETTEQITGRFLKQFEFFESALERDVALFFKEPSLALKQTVEDTRQEISESKETLNKLRANPELYRDPLTLFEVRLRQQEWGTVAGKRVHSTQ
jgi:GTP-binding protein EngB required for normal cell division